MGAEYDEDHLDLLAPPVAKQTPEQFHKHVESMYEPRDSTGKLKDLTIQGRKLNSATKNMFGIYELNYQRAEGLLTCYMAYRAEQLPTDILKRISALLKCGEERSEDFLLKKNLFPCMNFDLKLPIFSNLEEMKNARTLSNKSRRKINA